MIIPDRKIKKIEFELDRLFAAKNQEDDYIKKNFATYRYLTIYGFLLKCGLKIRHYKIARMHKITTKTINSPINYSDEDWLHDKDIIAEFSKSVGFVISRKGEQVFVAI